MATLPKKNYATLRVRAKALNLDVDKVQGYLIPFRGQHGQGYFCQTLDAVERRLAEIEADQP